MEEKELTKLTPPELTLHNVEPFWELIDSLYHQRKMSAEMIGYHLNYQDINTIKDIINYYKNLRNAGK